MFIIFLSRFMVFLSFSCSSFSSFSVILIVFQHVLHFHVFLSFSFHDFQHLPSPSLLHHFHDFTIIFMTSCHSKDVSSLSSSFVHHRLWFSSFHHVSTFIMKNQSFFKTVSMTLFSLFFIILIGVLFFFIFITFYHVASASSFSLIFVTLHPSLSLSSLFIVSDCSSLLMMIVYDFASVFIMLYHFQYFPCFHDFHDSSSFSSFSSFSAFSLF